MIIFFIALLMSSNCHEGHCSDSGFSQYFTPIYSGKMMIPNYYYNAGEFWRDDMGKVVEKPEINFAGEYYIGTHSCGTDCRYFTLSNLKDGLDYRVLDSFSSSGEAPKRASDGNTYGVRIISRPYSRLLVVQYIFDESKNNNARCEEQLFLFDAEDKEISPIGKRLHQCSAYSTKAEEKQN